MSSRVLNCTSTLFDALGPEETEQQLTVLLHNLIQANRHRTFGECRTCQFFIEESVSQYKCGLTRATLLPDEALKICYEHEYPNKPEGKHI